jgi:hypothetical protein
MKYLIQSSRTAKKVLCTSLLERVRFKWLNSFFIRELV